MERAAPTRCRGRAAATALRTDAAIETKRIAATLGQEARASRRRRRRTQASVAGDIGISRSRYAELERGEGAMAPLDTWVRAGLVLGRPLAVALSRDSGPGTTSDSGHLVAQEWVLEQARSHGRDATFELRTGPGPAAAVADVVIRDDPHRTLEFIEIWNRLDDLGAATRSSDRKVIEASVLASMAGGDDRPYRLGLGWLLVDTAANRALVARFPAIIATRFPGSSLGLVRALRNGAPFPDRPAIAWFDPRGGDIRPLRVHRRDRTPTRRP